MTDFYNLLFNRPHPGRALKDVEPESWRGTPRTEGNPARRSRSDLEVIERQLSLRDHVGGQRLPPDWAGGERGRYEDAFARSANEPVIGPGGVVGRPEPEAPSAPEVPFAALSGQSTRPFGEDFVDYYETTRSRPLPMGVDAADETPLDPPDNPGRAPRNRNNIPLGIEGGTTYEATRVERGVSDRAPVRRVDLPAVEREWDEARQAGIRGPVDPNAAWHAAERAAAERWERGEPTPVDAMFRLLFGYTSAVRLGQVERETAQMREEIRADGKQDSDKGGGGSSKQQSQGTLEPSSSVAQRQQDRLRDTSQPTIRTDPVTGWPLDPITGEAVAPLEWERRMADEENQRREDEARTERRNRWEPTENGVRFRRRF